MELCDLLGLTPGILSLIGGGGKTTMLKVLAEELSRRGRVALCTTTHIRPVAGLPLITGGEEEALAAWESSPALCLGTPAAEGKLTAAPIPMARLAQLCDYVLVEADGSRHRPCKAHASHEPVVPPESQRTILLLGAGGFGLPIREAAHRPERYAALVGVGVEEIVTAELAARVLSAEGLHHAVFVNQMETAFQRGEALRLTKLLSCPVYGGALQKGEWECLSSFEGPGTWPPALH